MASICRSPPPPMTDDELKRVVRIMDHGLAGALPTCRSGRELVISLTISFCIMALIFGIVFAVTS